MMETVVGFIGEGAVYASYLKQAYRFAYHSPDPSTQVGCVIVNPTMGVVSGASNSPPLAISISKINTPVDKALYMEHAERNALYRCAQSLMSSKDCHAYTTLPPCIECARGLIQSGISKVVSHKEMLDRYLEKASPTDTQRIEDGIRLLDEVGVPFILWSGTVFPLPTVSVRVKGSVWTP